MVRRGGIWIKSRRLFLGVDRRLVFLFFMYKESELQARGEGYGQRLQGCEGCEAGYGGRVCGGGSGSEQKGDGGEGWGGEG